MKLKVREQPEGQLIEGPTGDIEVDLEPTDDFHDVMVCEPGSGDGTDMCKITGKTYEHKEKIKKLPYGDDGTRWTGEWWEVNKSMVTELCAVLCIAAVDVCVHSKCVAKDEDWGSLRKRIDIDEGREEDSKLRIVAGPKSPMEGVSRSWAEDAAEVGNFDDADDFAEEYGLNIIEDEEAKEMLEGDDDEKDSEVGFSP